MTSLDAKSRKAGFTIIEVLIVLAIAGLILSLVMLAIPTLQRNARNNQRNQDVQSLLAEVSRFGLNNSGNFPANSGSLSGANLTFYENSGIIVTPKASGVLGDDVPTIDQVYIYNYQRCKDDASGTATTFAAGYSDVVAIYAVEAGNSGSKQICKEL